MPKDHFQDAKFKIDVKTGTRCSIWCYFIEKLNFRVLFLNFDSIHFFRLLWAIPSPY